MELEGSDRTTSVETETVELCDGEAEIPELTGVDVAVVVAAILALTADGAAVLAGLFGEASTAAATVSAQLATEVRHRADRVGEDGLA